MLSLDRDEANMMTGPTILRPLAGSPSLLVHAAMLALLAAPAPVPMARQAAPPMQSHPKAPGVIAPTRAPFSVKSTLAIPAKLELGDFAWNDDHVPPGPIEVVADLLWQRLYVYQGGIEIGRS